MLLAEPNKSFARKIDIERERESNLAPLWLAGMGVGVGVGTGFKVFQFELSVKWCVCAIA